MVARIFLDYLSWPKCRMTRAEHTMLTESRGGLANRPRGQEEVAEREGKKVDQQLDCKRIVKARFRVSSIVSSVLGFRSDCMDYLSGS